MSDFIHEQGPAFLAHLLRRVSDDLVKAAEQWYPEVGVSAPPRTTSTLLVLDDGGPLGVTEIASRLRQSHPLVIVWIRQLDALGFVETRSDPKDGRRSVVRLTRQGRAEVRRVRRALEVMGKVSQQLMDETGTDVLPALCRMDESARRRPVVDRLRAVAPRVERVGQVPGVERAATS